MLKAHGSDINAYTWDNYTPIHEAVENGCLDFVELLVEWGAELDIRPRKGRTPLELAKALRRWDIVEVLSR